MALSYNFARRSGSEGEKICFIFDESNVLETSFLERMNTLLTAGHVPGLFEGEELSSLLASLRLTMHRKVASFQLLQLHSFRAFLLLLMLNAGSTLSLKCV